MNFYTFDLFYEWMRKQFVIAKRVHTETWQSIDVSTKPEAATYEILMAYFTVPLRDNWSLDYLRKVIAPNLPWADDHFLERIGGEPLNPGVQWAKWHAGASADRFRDKNTGQFSHTYMERFWPKYANVTDGGKLGPDFREEKYVPHGGVRYSYGDLNDVIALLKKEPNTRQAYLPIFFPEDTGCHAGVRIPCTLGYHFIQREGRLHIVYYLRSCDAANHLADDIYLAVRLQKYVAEQCGFKLGTYAMQITSLHMFVNDYAKYMSAEPAPRLLTKAEHDLRLERNSLEDRRLLAKHHHVKATQQSEYQTGNGRGAEYAEKAEADKLPFADPKELQNDGDPIADQYAKPR